jgi:hypothetical protein
MPAIAVMFAASTRNGYTAGEGKSVSSQRLDGGTAVVAQRQAIHYAAGRVWN